METGGEDGGAKRWGKDREPESPPAGKLPTFQEFILSIWELVCYSSQPALTHPRREITIAHFGVITFLYVWVPSLKLQIPLEPTFYCFFN